MILFITVGTHEQPFNRLVKAADLLAQKGKQVFIQTGYSTYEPKHAAHEKLIGADEMDAKMREADVIVTHGGPGSIMAALEVGKKPVAVPRQVQFAEHVNDHQVEFCRFLAKQGKCFLVEDIDTLETVVEKAATSTADMSEEIKANRAEFVRNFRVIAERLIAEKKSKRK